jgi:hypothetical protein
MTEKSAPFLGAGSCINEVHHDAVSEQILEALRGLRFGSVLLIIQDGVVVQIERTEKKRITRIGNSNRPKEQ